ncbi:MAG: hypothetical protein ACUVXI_18480 [bacterium]
MPEKHKRVRKVILKAVLHPLALIVVAVAIGTSFLIKEWWILILGFVGYAIIVFNNLRSEEFVRRAAGLKKEDERALEVAKAETPDISKLREPYKEEMRAISSIRSKIGLEVETSDDFSRTLLAGSINEIDGLIPKAYDLSFKAQSIDEYLKAVDDGQLEKDISHLRRRIESSTDDVAKAQYEQALSSRREQLENYRELERSAERIRAQLVNIKYALENTLSKIIKIKAADERSTASESDILLRELKSLSAEMSSLGESVSAILRAETER